MKNKTATLIGASGLIGSSLLKELLQSPIFEKVIILVRKDIEITHQKMEQRIIDFNNTEAFKNAITNADAIFCCIGTTQNKVKGNKEEYRKVDYNIPVNAAHFANAIGIKKYLLISAIGANSKSNNFYLKLKGEVEEAIVSLPFQAIHILQPSLLIGKRNERRIGEKIAQLILPIFNPLLIGALSKYKSIKAEDVAKAMYELSIKNNEGVHFYDYTKMKNIL